LPGKISDLAQDSLIDIFLRFISEVLFSNEQGMIATFYRVEKIGRCHFDADGFEQIERAKCVACSLNEKGRRSQREQNFVSQFRALAHCAERIT